MGRFAQSTSIFENRRVFHESYVPDELPGRQEEMKNYLIELQPIMNGDPVPNILTYGETGVGKSVATRRILNELQTDTALIDDIEFTYVWMNCKDRSSYQVATKLVNKMRDPENQISGSGYSKSQVIDKLWESVNESDASHVLFVLDEIDSLGSDDSLIYQIPRAQSNGYTDKDVGLIGISNNFTFRDNISARSENSLRETELHFPSYGANELREILEKRAAKAFTDDVLGDGVIPYLSAKVARDSGSARDAIDILEVSGKLAMREGAETITEALARRAVGKHEELIYEKELSSLPIQSQVILQAVVVLADAGTLPARRNEIYTVYKHISQSLDIEAKSSRTVHNHLSKLSLKGFLNHTEKNKGEAGGKYWQYDLDLERDVIDNVLDSVDRLENVREHVDGSTFA